jgi:hypothetical protein
MHTAIRIRYPDIREDLSEKISGYSISDGYQTYCFRIRYPNKISVFVSVIRKKSVYPKILSEPVFTIFESGSGRIFSEPYYIPSPGGSPCASVPGGPAPRRGLACPGARSAFPCAQAQRAWRSNLGLISFKFSLMSELRRATNLFNFRFY